jgi:hypothetical protein
VRGVWLCRDCLDVIAAEYEKPFLTGDDLAAAQVRHPEARTWEEWRYMEQSPSEPHQEPVQIAPYPPDAFQTPSGTQSTPGGSPERIPEVRRGKTPIQPREREPGTKKPSPPPDVVYVPVPPARPDPTPHAPVERIPIHRPEPMQSAPVRITHLVEPGALPEQMRPVPHHTMRTDPPFEKERQISNPPEDSKRNFEKPQESKKEFDPAPAIEGDAPVFDRDGDQGRWRTDEQVRELVIYRWEFKRWPDDVENKASKETRTGLESYYELRYFKEGTNRKGERYSELYGKHRAKRDLWIEEECQQRAIQADNAPLDPAAAQSNMVHFAARRTYRAR